MKNNKITIDVTTTSVGRDIILETYESFFNHIKFDGFYNFIITIDPSYGVTKTEIENTIVELNKMLNSNPKVISFKIEHLEVNVGLERSLTMLLSNCFNDYGINLEDDWIFFKDLDVNLLLEDLNNQNSTMIGFSSTHLENRGTFSNLQEIEKIENTNIPLIKLVPPNWAADYLPLCPNIHNAKKWIPVYIKGLMMNYDPLKCPEERVKEFIREQNLRQENNMLWTEEVIVKDIGREWLIKNNQVKNITPDFNENPEINPKVKLIDNEIDLSRSNSMIERARKSIPGDTQTFMKRPINFSPGHFPVYAEKGKGSKLWDIDGNIYIDYIAGLGTLSLGYDHKAISQAIKANIGRGTIFSLPTWLEIEASEALIEIIPNIEMVRFLKTGSDACLAAITLSRYITNKSKIISIGYHGWVDHFEPHQPGGLSDLSKNTIKFEFNENTFYEILKYIEVYANDIACLILALPYNFIPTKELLKELQNKCNENKIIFVVDEVVTGFRLSIGGASEYFGLEPDLLVYSKSLSAGMPISAICGKKELMKEFEVLHVSTTYGGEILSLACVVATINEFKTKNIVNHLWEMGYLLRKGINDFSNQIGLGNVIIGYNPLPYLNFQLPSQAITFISEMAKMGVLFRKDVSFITSAHSVEDINYTIKASHKVLLKLANEKTYN